MSTKESRLVAGLCGAALFIGMTAGVYHNHIDALGNGTTKHQMQEKFWQDYRNAGWDGKVVSLTFWLPMKAAYLTH